MQTRILVIEATGNQGGAVLQALLDLNDDTDQILGLTRNPDRIQAWNLLAKHKNVQLITGDYDKPTAIFEACGTGVDSIFLISTPPSFPPNADIEEQQGKALIDATIAHGVKHFVQTTVDRGPESDTNPTEVPHYISKFNIERHFI